jgi:threonine dehydratase
MPTVPINLGSRIHTCKGLVLTRPGNTLHPSLGPENFIMQLHAPIPLIRLSNLFPQRQVYAKCEFLGASGSFKTRGARHLLERLTRDGRTRRLVVPSMGNTVLGAANAAAAFGFSVMGVVPQTIGRAKDEKLRALGVELVKVGGGSTEVLRRATEVAEERQAYFVHPHLDPLWTDGYQIIAEELLVELPACRSLVFPVGGGGLLMGLTDYFLRRPAPVQLFGCEAHNSPTYARYEHERSATIADGLLLEVPHPQVRERIEAAGVTIGMVHDEEIRKALAALYLKQALIVEPSSAITLAFVEAPPHALEEPACVLLTGQNIGREDFDRLVAGAVSPTGQ